MGDGPVVLADLELARRLEAADAWVGIESAHIHAQLHPESGAVAEPVADGYAVFTGVGSPFTLAIGLGMRGPVNDVDMMALENFFRLRGSAAQIEVCPLADRSLYRLVFERGYRLRESTNVLFRVLTPGEPPDAAPSRVSVQGCSPEEAELWARTVARGFAEDLLSTAENLKVLTSLFHRPGAVCVLAWLDGAPAGGGALSVHEGVAAMYGASTLPSFRRRGVQAAIIQSLVAAAAGAGCAIAFTLTEPGSVSQHNLERQGFRVAYTRASMVKSLLD